jgi:hypothetical protein
VQRYLSGGEHGIALRLSGTLQWSEKANANHGTGEIVRSGATWALITFPVCRDRRVGMWLGGLSEQWNLEPEEKENGCAH